MSCSTLTAHNGSAQHPCNQTASERSQALASLPPQWHRGLLAIGHKKEPICPTSGLPLAHWPTAPAPSAEELLTVPAIGLRSGTQTDTLCLDFDGPEAWAIFERLFGGTARQVLPQSIAWASGKPMRCQVAFAIKPEHHHLLRNKRRKIDALEMRWEGQQSVLMGHHPEMPRGYRWLQNKAPWQIELAPFPIELLDLVPNTTGAPKRNLQQPRLVTGLVVPLQQFITLRSRFLIERGSVEGSCNADAIALSIDLVSAEGWLKSQGVSTDMTAQDAFEQYCSNCPAHINGRPLDLKAMWRRFEGAVQRNPEPPTPEGKLVERLDYHRRMASRATRRALQEVAA